MGSTDGDGNGDEEREPAKVAVVGSYNAGYVAEVPHLPVPGETVTATNYEEVPGGKGSNQAVAAARLDADAYFVGCVGRDRRAETAYDLWDREGVDATNVADVDEQTGLGIVFVEEDGENEIVISPGANHELDRERVRAAADTIGACDVLLTQLETSDEAVAAAVEIAADRGLDVVLNPAPARELSGSVLRHVDFLTPNETEARTLAGRPPDDDVDPETLSTELRDLGVGTVVLTLGGDGALLADGTERVRVPAPDVEVVDTTGAGDAFNGAFAVALAEGATPEEAVRFGCAAGAASVTTFDVIPSLPSRGDLDVTGSSNQE